MHRDVKLGLALGILVIGFAAAFCFPRQSATELAINPTTGLKLAAIDDEIRLERRRTFVGDELNPPEQPTLAEPIAASAIDADLPPLQTAAMRAQAALRSAPDPIRREVPPPIEQSDNGLLVQTPIVPVVETPVVEPEVEETFYTVQPGDTLSAVASKTLGSVRRYEEIYEANRDVMSTPNSLKIGMKLRIPQSAESIAKRKVEPAAPVVQKVIESPRLNEDAPFDRRGMFSPLRPQHARSGDSIAR